jgi:L-asparaginase
MTELEGFYLFIATGGTIEFLSGKTQKIRVGAFETTYQKPNFRKDSIIPSHLEAYYPELDYAFEQVCMLDSKDVGIMELLKVERLISDSDSRYIIITHGTDTIVENAKMLEKWLAPNNKVIIFVGAFRPLEDDLSDGELSIKQAIENAPKLTNGVYISGSGSIYDCKSVVKDFDRGEFVSR